MGDNCPEMKAEEQYPLLKVDGGGDSPTTPAVLTPGWGVQCSRKNWCSRWPEFISACWMTLILFGISFLVFYALGMGAYRRQQFVFTKCSTCKPGTRVFYHHLLQHAAKVPFLQHSEYLSSMATQYPNLHFQVYYLIDDSRLTPEHFFINKRVPIYNFAYGVDENCRQAIAEFKKRFPNVNICIMPLTKYMSETPLRYKWRSIPASYLPFYARAFSVWENGGVGMDLALHSVSDESSVGRRKEAILRQHNDGINPEAYANALNRIDNEEDKAMFTLIFGFINRFLNETRSFINRTLTYPVSEPKSDVLMRSKRDKQDLIDDSVVEINNHSDVLNSSVNTMKQNNSSLLDFLTQPRMEPSNKILYNATGAPEVIFIDFHVVSDTVGPSYRSSESLAASKPSIEKSRSGRDAKRPLESHLLSVDAEGTFIAASAWLHPFLRHIITTCCQSMVPRAAIQDAILSQCSGMPRSDVYCNNIYIL